MAMLLMMTMAESNNSNANNNHPTEEAKPTTIFHDFLGGNCASDSSPAAAVKPAAGSVGGDGRLSDASASVGASSGGGRGPISATSDLGSERQVANHFEGVPFHGARSDLSGSEISNRFTGNKRSNSDCTFPSSSRDGFPQVGPDSLNGLHLMKMLRNAGRERPRRSHDEATFFGVHPMRPTPASLMLHPAAGSRTDASKWERAVPPNIGPVGQYPPRVGQVTSFGCQVPSNRFRDANSGPLAMSQAAADEGSRTGIKGPGILSSVNTNSGVSDRIPSGVLLSACKQKLGNQNAEPEFSTPLSRHGLASAGRQMTIFYGGQAHVFDDVHPNKADVIMALAGSNGGSWSTNYLPKSAAPVSGESFVVGGENETGVASNFLTMRDFRGRLPVMGTSSHGLGSGDQMSMPTGGHQGSRSTKDGKTPVQATETGTDEKR